MHKELIYQKLQELFPKSAHPLCEMAAYSLEGGKRLRPLLTLAVVDAFGASVDKALLPACTIEMIHAYSLIHDDLPCMDDDDLRRGRPTLHRVYPESHALLTGDFLLTHAFELLATAPMLTDSEKRELISVLALRSGRKGMIGGQIMDMEKRGIDEASLLQMHLQKTAALFTASLEFGAILSSQKLPPFQALGEHLGLAFQLADDMIDKDGAVSILGEDKVKEWLETSFEKALGIIRSFPRGAPKLEKLAEGMIFRTV